MSKTIYDEAVGNTQILLALVHVTKLNAKKKLDMLTQIEEALERAQKQEQEHIEYSKKVQEQFSNDTKRIGELESKLIRQEKLLKLYQKYFNDYDDLSLEEETDIYTQIKELENE